MASRRALAVLCVAWMTGRVVDGFAYPEKITYATPDPAGAQRFAEKHFGMLRRVFNFQSKSSSACAQRTLGTHWRTYPRKRSPRLAAETVQDSHTKLIKDHEHC